MNNILHYVINTVLISLPEQFFISLMAIAILKGLSTFQASRNKKLILIILPALISNLPELLGLNSNYSLVAGIVVNTIIFAILTKKKIYFVLLSVFAAMAIYAGTELVCVSLIMHSINISLQEIQQNSIFLFLTSLPERAIQYTILYLAAFKKLKYLFKNRPVDVSLISIVRLDKSLIRNSLIALVMTFIYILFFSKLIALDGVFLKLTAAYSLLACSLIFFLPYVFFMTFSEIVVRDYINRLAIEKYEKEYRESHKNIINHKLVQAYKEADENNDEGTLKVVREIITTVNTTM